MNDNDPKDRPEFDIDSEAIDHLLEAIDEWEFGGALGEQPDDPTAAGPADPTAAGPADPTAAGPADPTAAGPADPTAPVQPTDDLEFSWIDDTASSPSSDSPAPEAARPSKEPLYMPPVDLIDDEEEDRGESTRMVDLRADDRYHELVRSIREQEALEKDRPTPVPSPRITPSEEESSSTSATVIAQVPMAPDDDEDSSIFINMSDEVGEDDERLASPSWIPDPLASSDAEMPWETIIEDEEERSESETVIAPVPEGLRSASPELTLEELSSPPTSTNGQPTEIASDDSPVAQPLVDDALEEPPTLVVNASAPALESPPAPSPEPATEVARPTPEPTPAPEPEVDEPAASEEIPYGDAPVTSSQPLLEPMEAEVEPALRPQRRQAAQGIKSGMAVVHMGEDELRHDIVALLDEIMPRQEVGLPAPDEALASTDELISRLESYGPTTEEGVEPRPPEELAERCHATAEASADVVEAAALVSESARLLERRVGDHELAEKRYALALQLDPTSSVALSGRRRTLLSLGRLEELEEELEQELEGELSDRERAEVLLLKAESALSKGDDPGLAIDISNELPEVAGAEVRTGLIGAEVSSYEGDEGGLAERAAALATKVTDEPHAATLWLIAGRASEAIADHEVAEAHYRAAVELDSSSPSALAGLGRVLSLREEKAAAAGVLIQLSELFGGEAVSSWRRRAASLFVATGKAEEARRALGDPSGRLEWAVALDAALTLGERTAEAAALLELAQVVKEPTLQAALLAEWLLLGVEGDFERFERTLERAAVGGATAKVSTTRSELARRRRDLKVSSSGSSEETDERSPVALFRSALRHDQAGTVDQAHQIFVQLASEPRTAVEAEAALSVLAAAAGDWLALSELLQRSIERSSSVQRRAAMLVQLGRINELRLDDREGALLAYTTALGEQSSLKPALSGVLRTASDASARLEAARAIADDASSRLGAAALQVEAARLAEEAGDRAAADKIYEAVLAAEPRAETALVARERFLHQEDRRNELLQLWGQAASGSDPLVSADFWTRAAWLYSERQDPQAASALLEQTFDLEREDWSVAESLAHLSMSRSAADRLERIAETMAGARAEVLLIIATELRAEDDPDAALSCLERVLEDQPDRSDLVMMRERLVVRMGAGEALLEQLQTELDGTEDVNLKVSLLLRMIAVATAMGDLEAETRLREALVEVEPGHLATLHWLAGRYQSDQRWEELARLFGLLAYQVTDDADVAALAAMSMRLRASVDGRYYSDINLAAYAVEHEPEDLRALQTLYFTALGQKDWEWVHVAASGLARNLGIPRCRAVFELRDAAALEQLGREEEALEPLRRAASGEMAHPIAAWQLSRLAEQVGAYEEAAQSAFESASIALVAEHRKREFLRAARLWLDRVGGERERALEALAGALEADPGCDEAFELAREVMTEESDPRLSLALVVSRLAGSSEAAERVELGMQGATLAFELGERAKARTLLKAVLEVEPTHVAALEQLAEALYEDEEWSEAAAAVVRLARATTDPAVAQRHYFRLGVIYQEKLPDLRRAIASFQKMLSYEPNHLDALRRLSGLLFEGQEWKAACEVTHRLAQLEVAPEPRREALVRLSQAYERGFNDTWRAERALDEARRIDPTDLAMVEEMARFYQRGNASQALMVHLDRAATDFRRLLEKDPCDLRAYHGLFRVFTLRGRDDSARLAAAVLQSFGQDTEPERAALERAGGMSWMPGPAVADTRLDEDISPATMTHSLRLLSLQIGDNLTRLLPQDPRRIGVGRGNKLGRGDSVRELANAMLGWYGVGQLDIYVHPSQPTIWSVFASSPPSLVLGQSLLDGADEGELRFLIGRALGLLQRRMVILAQLEPVKLGLLLPALAKATYSAYELEDIDEAAVMEMAREVTKVLPRRVRNEVGPLALECVGDQRGPPAEMSAHVTELADRVGLLAAGSLEPAFRALRRMAALPARPSSAGGALEYVVGDPCSGSLLRFFVSAEHVAAREKLGLASPI